MSENTAADTAAPSANAGFADDDLGRLQGILLGDHARRTNERIDTLEQALLGAVADLKAELAQQVQALAGRIDGEQSTRTQALANLADRVKDDAKTAEAATKKLQQNLDKATSSLETAVHDSTTDARLELETARRELSRVIEDLGNTQRDYAVDRRGLASMLAAMAENLEATDVEH